MSADNEKEMTDFSFPWGRPEEIPHVKSSLQDTRDLRDASSITKEILHVRWAFPLGKRSYREVYDETHGA